MDEKEWGVFLGEKIVRTFYTKEQAEKFEDDKNRMFQSCALYTKKLTKENEQYASKEGIE